MLVIQNAKQKIMHLYIKCWKWQAKQQVLKKNLGKAEIQWPRRPEKKRLAKLPADQYVIGLVLKFLKNTEVGNRTGKIEREDK